MEHGGGGGGTQQETMKTSIFIIMKRTIIMLLAMATCLGHARAQAAKETIQKDIQVVAVGDANSIVITQGTENTVTIDGWTDTQDEPITVAGSKLTVNTDASEIRLTLKPGTLRAIEAEDAATATVEMPFEFSGKVTLEASDAAAIRLLGTDEMRCTTLAIGCEDAATVSIECPVAAQKAEVNASDFATVSIDNLSADTLGGLMQDGSKVKIPNCNAKGVKLKYMDSTGNVREVKGVVGVFAPGQESPASGEAPHGQAGKDQGHHDCDRFSGDFGLGWGTWGKGWNNSAAGLDGGYDARTAFSSIFFQFSYAIVCRPKCRLELGMGLDWKKIALANNYVMLANPSGGAGNTLHAATTAAELAAAENVTGRLADPEAWTTQARARYLVLPARIAFGIRRANMEVGLAAVTKVNISGKRQGLAHHMEADDMEATRVDARFGDYVRPVALDARIDLVFDKWIGAYAQAGLTPMTRNLDKNPYNFEFGLFIRML